MNKNTKKACSTILYIWAAAMCIIIVSAIVQVVYEEPYAWFGVGIGLVVLYSTKNKSIITLGAKKVPKTRTGNGKT